MKFTPIPVLLALLVPAIAALPAGESVDLETQSPNQNEVEALVCADNLCVGINKNKLCNDRCRACTGPSGQYKRGECGGILWQTCYCYYDLK